MNNELDNNPELPEGITREMIDQAKEKYGKEGMVKLVDLEDGEGNFLGTVLMVRPTKTVIDQMERHVAENPATAYDILKNGCLLSHKQEIAEKTSRGDKMYAAVIDACQNMLPYSKPDLLPVDEGNLPEGITADMVDEAKVDKKKNLEDMRIAYLQKNESGDTLPVLVCTPSRKAITDHEKWGDRNPKKAKQAMIDSSLCSHIEEVNGNDWLWFAAYSAAVQLKPKGVAKIKNC